MKRLKTQLNSLQRTLKFSSYITICVAVLVSGCAAPQAKNAPDKVHSLANGLCLLICFYQYQEADGNADSTITESESQTATVPINTSGSRGGSSTQTTGSDEPDD